MHRTFLTQWNELQRKLAGFGGPAADPHGSSCWTPNTDVYESPNGLIVKAELAGVPADGVEVRLDEQALVITGIRRDPLCSETAAGYRFRQMEIEYGLFQRVVPLPFAVDGATAKAQFHGGILTVHLARARSRKATHIYIQLSH